MNTSLPLYSIQQTVDTYHYLFKKNPTFGMNIFEEDFEINDIVLLDDVKGGTQGIPIHFDYYALFLRVDGETQRKINQFTYHIQEHSLQLVNPGSIYSFKDTTQNSRTYVLLFNQKFIEDNSLSSQIQKPLLDFHKKHQKDVKLDITQYSHIVSIYEELSNELRAKKDDYITLVKILINQLLVLLKREKLKNGLQQHQNRSQQISCEFLLLIENNYLQKRSVKEYASILGITPKHLSETVKSTLNNNARSYIHIRMLKEIQYLLCFTNMPIKQIANVLNFSTLSQLGRFFKSYEGVSPKEYRLKNKLII